MTMKLIAPGRGDRRDCVIVYHLNPSAGEIQGRIRASAPDAIIVNDTSTVAGYYLAPMRLDATIEFARKQSGALGLGRTALVGFSAGCQALRAHLIAGAEPDALIPVDGTHCSKPPNERTQIWPWKTYAEKARDGRCVMVASHTNILPPNFTGTRTTLEHITGWPLPPNVEGRRQEGKLVVHSYTGTDAAAHISQARNALSRMVAEAMDLLGARPPSVAPPPVALPPSAAWLNPALPLGERCVLWSLAEMERGVCEAPAGSNRSPDIDRYLDPAEPIYRRNTGERLRLRGVAWCAAAAGAAHRACARPGEAYPTVRVSGAEMVEDAVEVGAWRPVAAVRLQGWTPRLGDIAIYDRSHEGSAWMRHVCRVAAVGDDGTFATIGGNEGDRWRLTKRSVRDSDLLGFVMVGV